ncbi:hypothetical protein JXB02_01370 [Candidatus Woesearchaeota archaeon]|nr:hypothetical protein [Candidatus Woesearchaeota archaeon]
MAGTYSPINVLYGRYPSKQMKGLFPLDEEENFRFKASDAMKEVWSDEAKYLGWRHVWVAHLETLFELGLPGITAEDLEAVRKVEKVIDYRRAAELERQMKHDTNAYLAEFKEQVERLRPGASAKIHAGGTSCLVTDNQEIMAMSRGLRLVYQKLENLYVAVNERFGKKMGKRISPIVSSDIELAQDEVYHRMEALRSRSAKGTTGTQASYLALFGGDHAQVLTLDDRLSRRLGYPESYALTGQTYPRIVDLQVLASLATVAEAVKGVALLENEQLDLVRRVKDIARSAATMASVQWMERTLDDSSERRLLLPEAFYAIDVLLDAAPENIYLDPNSIVGDTRTGPVLQKGTVERSALELIAQKTAAVITRMHDHAERYKDLPCAGYTHYQVAQATTWGKRLDLLAYQYALALDEVEHALKLRIPAGTVVSSALKTQYIGSLLMGIAASSAKAGHDLRLGQHDLEINEPFGKKQVGSSAMPFKKNPMKAERTCGLARSLIGLYAHGAEQDYAFLAADSLLELGLSIFSGDTDEQTGFTIHTEMVKQNLARYLPFLKAEELMMMAINRGVDGRAVHEYVREVSMTAWEMMKKGKPNQALELLADTKAMFLPQEIDRVRAMTASDFVGRSAQQVKEFGTNVVAPIRERYEDSLGIRDGVQV